MGHLGKHLSERQQNWIRATTRKLAKGSTLADWEELHFYALTELDAARAEIAQRDEEIRVLRSSVETRLAEWNAFQASTLNKLAAARAEIAQKDAVIAILGKLQADYELSRGSDSAISADFLKKGGRDD